MNVIFILIGIFMAVVMILVCEIHYEIYKDYEKTTAIAVIGLSSSLILMIIGTFI